ncbi:MAG: ABC transporter substrate-binding protein [Lachnospiraceae bacterium]|nr:ABC transporter substrate-binding protein [Lachnospiraceae bacterium]
MKSIIFSISLLISVIFLSACDSKSSLVNAETVDNIHYKTEFLTEINLKRILKITGFEDKLVLIGTFADENKEEAIKAITYDENGNQLSEIIFAAPDNTESGDDGWFSDAYVDENGFFWFLYSQIIETDGGLGYSETYIDCYDQTGNNTKTVTLLNEQPNLYSSDIRSFLVGEDGFFYICTEERYTAVFDSNGNLIYEPQNLKNIFKLPDDRVLAETATRGVNFETFFREIKAKEQELGENLQFDTTWDGNNFMSIYYISGGDEYDFLESTDEKIFGHNLKDEKRVELIDWSVQNIKRQINSHGHVVMLNKSIFVIESDYTREVAHTVKASHTLVKLEKTDTPPNMSKKVITLVTMHDTFALNGTIIEFNRNNFEYYIEIKNYYKEGKTFSEAITELNLDLASGKIPDILMISPNMPIDSYGEKGYYADLYEFIDKDPDLERSNYLPNILKMQETNGKLYSVATGFVVETVMSPASIFGEESNEKAKFTWDDFAFYLDEHKEVTIPIASMFTRHISKRKILSNAILLDMANLNKFNTPEFISMLKTINQYIPNPYIDATIDDYIEGRILFRNSTMWGFLDAKIPELIYFGEPIAYVGFPTINGTAGSYATLHFRMAISANSAVKDGAWEYVKGILTDFQFSGVNHMLNVSSGKMVGFPVHKEALNKMAEALTISTEERYTRTYDGITVTFDPALTNEETDKIIELIYSLETHEYKIDSGVMDIILGEADFYFAGQKTAEEVADIIQSRVNIYLAEIK